MKFRKKPVVIEAEQWFPDKPVEGVSLLSEMSSVPMIKHGAIANLTSEVLSVFGYIETLEGGHLVTPGDWIVTGVQGEKYPVKPGIFSATYDAYDEKVTNLALAIEELQRALTTDQGYHYSWQANIAMAFKDECHRSEIEHTLLHEVANLAAIYFLQNLCSPYKTEFKPQIP